MPTVQELVESDSGFREVVFDPTVSHHAAARVLNVGETSIRRYRTKHKIIPETVRIGSNELPDEDPTLDDEPVVMPAKGTVDVDNDGATINNVVVESPILDDWSPVFRLFNLDPDAFEVVDDTVRMSTWQQSARTKEGDRDAIQLYSYSARFRRVNRDMIPAAKIQEWRDHLLDREPYDLGASEPTLLDYVSSIPTAYALMVADPQLGKKGTDEAIENWKRGIRQHSAQIVRLQTLGHNIGQLHLAFMGDEHENVANSYTNQPHTIVMNRTEQLELDFDLSVWTIKYLSDLGIPMTASSVISNHGLWTRNDTKEPVTSNNDNSSTYIRRQVKKLFDELAPYDGGPEISWTIGDSTPGVVVDLAGVPAYFSHGFIEKGRGGSTEVKVQNAIERQILGDTDRLGNVPLWFMAHYHHFYTNEFQDRTLFGCPALEAEKSSEYMRDQYGVWSKPGMLGLLVGTHTERRFSDVNVY